MWYCFPPFIGREGLPLAVAFTVFLMSFGCDVLPLPFQLFVRPLLLADISPLRPQSGLESLSPPSRLLLLEFLHLISHSCKGISRDNPVRVSYRIGRIVSPPPSRFHPWQVTAGCDRLIQCSISCAVISPTLPWCGYIEYGSGVQMDRCGPGVSTSKIRLRTPLSPGWQYESWQFHHPLASPSVLWLCGRHLSWFQTLVRLLVLVGLNDGRSFLFTPLFLNVSLPGILVFFAVPFLPDPALALDGTCSELSGSTAHS